MSDDKWVARLQVLQNQRRSKERNESILELVTEDSRLETWEEFQVWASQLRENFLFRGVTQTDRMLTTTLERAAQSQVKIGEDNLEVNPPIAGLELETLLRFKSAAHHYLSHLPADEDIIGWLSIMQHYGAPTRMLDWTQSPYVALHFALSGSSNADSAIWVLDLDWLIRQSKAIVGAHIDFDSRKTSFQGFLNMSFRKTLPRACVILAHPSRINQRALAQQGLSLCSIDLTSFEDALIQTLCFPSLVSYAVLRRVVISRENIQRFYRELHRMNISETSLFPGLEGFARSLHRDIAMVKGTHPRYA